MLSGRWRPFWLSLNVLSLSHVMQLHAVGRSYAMVPMISTTDEAPMAWWTGHMTQPVW